MTTHSRLQALADPTRSRLLLVLEQEEVSVSELVAVLHLPQSTVSRHLKVLTDEGWVTSRADGTSRYYKLSVGGGGGGGGDEAWGDRVWSVVREDFEDAPEVVLDRERLAAVINDRRRRSREYFSSVAGRWEEIRSDLFGRHLDLTIALATLRGDEVVGDLGCGTGSFAAQLAPFVGRVLAVDSSDSMLEEAQGRLTGHANAEVRAGDLEALPLADGSLDVAILSMTLQFVAEPPRALAEAHRVLTQGGRLIAVDMTPHTDLQLAEGMGHLWRGFGAREIVTWLADVGFTRVQYRELSDRLRPRDKGLFLATATKH